MMKSIIAQIVVQPGIINLFLGALVTLFAWIVKEIFGVKRQLALIFYRLNSCQCNIKSTLKDKESNE